MSIKLCIMSPIEHLHIFSSRGDMLLALPHIAVESKAYQAFYNDSNREIILDSGVIELGMPMSFEELMRIAEIIGANEVALPDYLHDATKTIDIANSICKRYKDTNLVKQTKFMGIVQGNSVCNWLDCFEQLAENEMISTLGIGIYSVKKVFSSLTKKGDCCSNRLKCIELLAKKNLVPKNKKIHLLGLGDPKELLHQKQYPFIRSCDTTRPIIYGLQGIRYTENGEIPGGEYKGPKMDYFMKIPQDNFEDIMFNINLLKKYAE